MTILLWLQRAWMVALFAEMEQRIFSSLAEMRLLADGRAPVAMACVYWEAMACAYVVV